MAKAPDLCPGALIGSQETAVSSSSVVSSSSTASSSSAASCKSVTWAPQSGQTPDNTGGGTWSGMPTTKTNCFDISMSGYLCSGNFQITLGDDCKGKTISWNGVPLTLKSDNAQTTGTIPNPGITTSITTPVNCVLSQLYFTGCGQAGTLQDGKMTELRKSYVIPAGVCVDVAMNWDNPYWTPSIWLKCTGESDISLSINSGCDGNHPNDCGISYSNLCAPSDKQMICSVSN